jgi:hypothetical protein
MSINQENEKTQIKLLRNKNFKKTHNAKSLKRQLEQNEKTDKYNKITKL